MFFFPSFRGFCGGVGGGGGGGEREHTISHIAKQLDFLSVHAPCQAIQYQYFGTLESLSCLLVCEVS